MRIDGLTELYGVLGCPVTHSLSPRIHNTFFEQFGLNKVHLPLEIATEHFSEVFEALKRMRFFGFNVTSPYKEAVVKHLDRLEGVAGELGCVNAIRREDDSWVGSNTDGEGLCAWIESARSGSIEGRHIVVLGAGNAARAVFRAFLDRRPRTLTVVNRRYARFDDPFFRRYAGNPEVSYAGLDRAPVDGVFERADILVNVTTYGLGGREEDGSAFPMLSFLRPETVVVDTNYSATGRTAFLELVPPGRARHDGKGMLLYGARAAFRWWIGKDPDVERLSELLGVGPLA